MRTIDFEKKNNRWYVVKDDYDGDPDDLEMVEGADTLLDLITTDGKNASVVVYDEEGEVGGCSTLVLLRHDINGGTYQVENCKEYNQTVWLCNVAHLFFRGEHPERIYFKIRKDETNTPDEATQMPNMEFKKMEVTAVNFEIKKAVTITADMKEYGKYKTADAVKKALEQQVLETKVFNKEDLPKLKYQGRKEVLDEWKKIHPLFEAEKPHYDLERFLSAQESVYPIALEEMREGRKDGHWIWYIFPQQKGLGHSYNSQYYGLDGIDEAREYLKHPVLGTRLREICEVLLQHKGKDIYQIMGSSIDVLKLQTSMRLFDKVSPNDIFDKVLEVFFD